MYANACLPALRRSSHTHVVDPVRRIVLDYDTSVSDMRHTLVVTRTAPPQQGARKPKLRPAGDDCCACGCRKKKTRHIAGSGYRDFLQLYLEVLLTVATFAWSGVVTRVT
jgi:hypothetical protein